MSPRRSGRCSIQFSRRDCHCSQCAGPAVRGQYLLGRARSRVSCAPGRGRKCALAGHRRIATTSALRQLEIPDRPVTSILRATYRRQDRCRSSAARPRAPGHARPRAPRSRGARPRPARRPRLRAGVRSTSRSRRSAYISTSPFGSCFVDAGSACPIVWRPNTRARPRLCSAPAKHSDALAGQLVDEDRDRPGKRRRRGGRRRSRSADSPRTPVCPSRVCMLPSSDAARDRRGRRAPRSCPPARRDCRADRSRVPSRDGTRSTAAAIGAFTAVIQTLKPMTPTRRPSGVVTSRASTRTWSGGRLPSLTTSPGLHRAA